MKFSIYVFVDPRGKPYYVGKTNDMKRRRKEHLAEIAGGNTLPKYVMARKFRKQGHKFRMKVVARTVDESDALATERALIKKYRKQGHKLYNLTAGGPDEKPTYLDGRPRKSKRVVESKKPAKNKKKKKLSPKKKAKQIGKKRRKR